MDARVTRTTRALLYALFAMFAMLLMTTTAHAAADPLLPPPGSCARRQRPERAPPRPAPGDALPARPRPRSTPACTA